MTVDPLADLLPTGRPAEFDLLPEDERRWRFRLFLATWAIGAPLDLSWAIALQNGPAHIKESLATRAGISDDALRAAVVARADSPDDRGSGESLHHVEVTEPEGALETYPPLKWSPLTPPNVASTPSLSPGELLWDRLLAESRARSDQPSRVTVLVPPMRERGNQ